MLPPVALRLVEPLRSRRMDRRVGPFGGIIISSVLSLVLWAGLVGAFRLATSDHAPQSTAGTFTPVTVPYVAPAEAYKPPSPIEQKPAALLPPCSANCPSYFVPRV